MKLHHVHLTHPRGEEDAARAFYAGVLGLAELPKPPELEGRGGVWFQLHGAQLHLGVEDPEPPSRRHVALQVVDLDVVRGRLRAADIQPEEAIALEVMDRFYCRDPFGNRLEFLSVSGSAA